MIVAIDGPAGAGKSTVAQRVAQALGFQLIDTGAMFRAVAWQALEQGVDVTDGASLGALARALEFAFAFEGERNVARCNGEVLGDEIKQRVLEGMALRRLGKPEDIAAAVSYVSGDDAGFLTGQTICVDGGLTMC